ncbi:hypothetical protein BKA70DRAFT_1330724 [Coprinopsis sp. MPI-PUGE-AT-0042]|nr:hypothetical protein BKA70DRAFT_1330724 [Coprinopsis sp. MPI-PUGE-AT-0042]
MITLLDIPSRSSNRPWSSNTWRARFFLNYKNLPYKTEWVEYPDIASIYLKHNTPAPTTLHGRPYYSVPAILDDSSGKVVMIADSIEIAKYLDATYPDTPKIFPEEGEEAFEKQTAFLNDFGPGLAAILPMMFKEVLNLLNPASQDHFATARARDLNGWYTDKPSLYDIEISEEEREKGWASLDAFLDKMTETFGKSETPRWFLVDQLSFVDFAFGSLLIWIREVWGQDSKEWKNVITVSEGRWYDFLKGLEKYQTVA